MITLELICVIVIVVVTTAWLLYFAVQETIKHNERRTKCQLNIEQLMLHLERKKEKRRRLSRSARVSQKFGNRNRHRRKK
jgi:hypothetical protein